MYFLSNSLCSCDGAMITRPINTPFNQHFTLEIKKTTEKKCCVCVCCCVNACGAHIVSLPRNQITTILNVRCLGSSTLVKRDSSRQRFVWQMPQYRRVRSIHIWSLGAAIMNERARAILVHSCIRLKWNDFLPLFSVVYRVVQHLTCNL